MGFPEGLDFRKTETLGMQIVNTLVSQIDGAIELQPGRGTAFTIRFQEVNIHARHNMDKIRILIVEDEGLIARDIENMASTPATRSAACPAGTEAIGQAEPPEPDLILMDIILKGGMDGIEAAEKIRDQFNLPIIYLTVPRR